MLHDTKTVSGGDFDQETSGKMAPPFVAQLDCRNRGLKRREAGVGKERKSSGEGKKEGEGQGSQKVVISLDP